LSLVGKGGERQTFPAREVLTPASSRRPWRGCLGGRAFELVYVRRYSLARPRAEAPAQPPNPIRPRPGFRA